MNVQFAKSFWKQYGKLQLRDRKRIDSTINRFRKNPHESSLYNHPLKGDMSGYRGISAGFDLRIIFKEENGYAFVLMVFVGTHEQVY